MAGGCGFASQIQKSRRFHPIRRVGLIGVALLLIAPTKSTRDGGSLDSSFINRDRMEFAAESREICGETVVHLAIYIPRYASDSKDQMQLIFDELIRFGGIWK